ncbi:MAG: hypothetical protein GXO89_06505 [Chlorobi bacterium]|nr:hypothetical protein [Chlorobiota bacterium]
MKKVILTLVIILISISLNAKNRDKLTFLNGKTYYGKVKRIKNCRIKFKTFGSIFIIPSDSVYSVEFEDPFSNFLSKDGEELSGSEKCMRGTMDAEAFHGKGGFHFTMGVLFGPFAVIGAAVANPTPDKGKDTYMMSENREIFMDPMYMMCYKKKAKRKNVGNAAIGWGAGVLFLIIIAGSSG